ncbi:hypothetical protein [Deinococcus sp. 23YEL01]|uniref:hypothetical protein n=1 Tax=Deinococcus sp. 23YEL01 TaxID=2745871 RepID=UPI001E3B5E4A|nr:hypothetical protein [Deinococcus sp. 23YEL01]MCD0170565.1 hypothetical protein [Deinococcus sp. 23YEL01]
MSLQHVIEAARVAVTGRAGDVAHLDQVGGVVTHPELLKLLKMNIRDANHSHCDKHLNNFKQFEELLASGVMS